MKNLLDWTGLYKSPLICHMATPANKRLLSNSSTEGSPTNTKKKLARTDKTPSNKDMAETNRFQSLPLEDCPEENMVDDISEKVNEVIKAALADIDTKGHSSSKQQQQYPKQVDRSLIADIVSAAVSAISPIIVNAIDIATKNIIARTMELDKDHKKTTTQMKGIIQTQAWQIDAIEQYSRRDSIKVIGIPKPPLEHKEDTDATIVELGKRIGVDIKAEDISVSHRIPGKSKAIIAKFVRRHTKSEVMRAKSKLKDTEGPRVYIYEDLTPMRGKMLREIKKDTRVKTAFTREGRIHCVMRDGEDVITINNPDDLFKLNWDEDRIRATNLFYD